MKPSLQKFGDATWTQDKLERVRKYLAAYTKIMQKRPHKFAYIDAFAGTGYHELERDGSISLFDVEDQPYVDAYMDGSARKALQVEPRFNKYIFIEKSRRKASELERLKSEFPDRAADIEIKNEDANTCLQELCRKSWATRRAVLFVDPFGMQLTWDTLAAVAKTKAIDTWILFPVSAVNRLLISDGKIPAAWSRRLDLLFGQSDWMDVFFPPDKSQRLFDTESVVRSKAPDSMKRIGEYFNSRLESIFAGVAPKPYILRNSRGPLFLLCFAVANPQAVKPAVKIAQDILKQDK